MKLFKYKSLQNFEHVSDIFCNHRFYAAQFYDLNDPMEGLFDVAKGTKQRYINAIKDGKRRLKVCSFSQDMANILLWAHYADGFRGICIEIDVNDSEDFEVTEVTYSPFRVFISDDSRDQLNIMPQNILSVKAEAWEYEDEVRILTNGSHVKNDFQLKAIYLGLRTPDVLKKSIARLAPEGVPIFETVLSDSTDKILKGSEYLLPMQT